MVSRSFYELATQKVIRNSVHKSYQTVDYSAEDDQGRNLSLRGRSATTGQPSYSYSTPHFDQTPQPRTSNCQNVIRGAKYAVSVEPNLVSGF
jgi:hypothetical protein